MTRATWRIATIAAAAVAFAHSTACTSADDDTAHRPPPTVLDVPTLDGGTEPVWIYVATPTGPGPHPVVIYGHGQGIVNVANCTPDAPPGDHDAQTGARIADDLAREGYLAIAVYYRNRGAGIPAIGELRGRDHYILDARAFLAAAHLAHDHLGGDTRVALIGVSMGSFPATWATAPLPELADLQDGLDLVTSIPTAMLGNHIANTGRSADTLTSTNPARRRSSIALAAFASISPQLALELDPSLTADDLDASHTAGLTPAGVDLLRRTFLDAPDPSLPGCAAGQPVVCSDTCVDSTFATVAAEHGVSDANLADWLAPDTIAAIDYWSPPNAIDPGAATTNPMLAVQRALSPAYSLAGPLHVRRMLPLTSLGDHVVIGQLAGTSEPADLYLARLRSTGVTIPAPVPVVQGAECEHDDYLDPAKPQCGWDIVLDELATAFGR